MTKPRPLDAFTQRRLSEIGDRWTQAKRDHQIASLDMWLGVMLSRFDPDELEVLDRSGFLCQNDRDLLQHHGTVVHPARGRKGVDDATDV